jgi:CubicO group peptidase (beta-lactamase class C family)
MNTRPVHIIFAAGALLAMSLVHAQPPQPVLKDASAPQTAPPVTLPEPSPSLVEAQLTAENLAAFLDGMLPSSMAIGDIAGAVVAVVKDDRLLLTRAYGLADVAKRTPVTADTLFRPASISKLFTWTAVMQQVEAGKLDLERDIDDYLDFKITGYGGEPIKLRHLMTHTAGFEESLLDLLIDDPSKVKPLQQALKEAIPERIYPPGTVPAYSNYGASLAGYIVQRVSGEPFEEYIERHIFQPLRMNHSTFRQPVPAPLEPFLSNGYHTASGAVVPFELGSDTPAGALSASAPDMAQFMMAHLNGGLLPGADETGRILKPATTELMHSVANRPGPSVDAMAYGFYEQSRNGMRVIAHGGDLTAFHSELVLIPAAKVGLFVSFNSVGKANATYKVRTALYEGFMDRYFPRRAPQTLPPAPPEAKEHARAVAGMYELSRRAQTNLFSFFYVFGQQPATAKDDGTLEVGGLTGLNDERKQFREVSPWLWQEAAGEMRMAAVRDDSGTVRSLVPDGYGPIFVFQPTPAWRNKAWLQPAILFSAAVLGISLLSWLVIAVRRRFVPSTTEATVETRKIRRASLAAAVACSLFAVLVGTVLVMFSSESSWIISSAARPFIRLVQLSALLAVLGAIAAVVAAAWSWRTAVERWPKSFGTSLLAAACLVWAYIAIAFHFLSLRLSY